MITCLGLSPALDVTYGVGALTVGGIHRPDWKLALPGGKFLNVARALHLLGEQVSAIAPLGGAIGEQIGADLRAGGLDVVTVETEAPTRMCVSVTDAADGRITEFYEHAAALDDAVWTAVLSAIAAVDDGWLAVSGSVPDERIDDLASALAAASERGIRLALDQRGAALDAALAAISPEIVKINRSEAEEAVGAGTAEELAVRLRERGARTAIVTDGAAGAVAADPGGVRRVAALDAGPYTVGAGDCFLAGLLSGLQRDLTLDEALCRAAWVAAANTLRPGAALFDLAQADLLSARASVRHVTEVENAS